MTAPGRVYLYQHSHSGISYGEGVRTLTLRRPLVPTALAATLLAAFVFLFAWPQPAAAHDALIASDPAADSTIETMPEELTLTFSAALISGEGTTAVEVVDADGNSVIDGEPTVDGAVVIQPLLPEAAAGEYHVEWLVLSSDGHPTDGTFGFTTTTSTLTDGAEASATPSADPSAEPSSEPSPEPSADESAEPTQTAAPAPDVQDASPATGWIWTISIVGVLIVAVVAAWLIIRSRKNASSTGSDTPTER